MSQTVLIADDSIPLHGLIKTLLGSESIEFRSAYDGEAAVRSAESLRPDLILLDIDMPRLDGFEVCRALKANTTTASIPLIFLTSSLTLTDKVKGLEMGAIDYIVKPFKTEELRARIRAALRTSRLLDQARMIDGLTGLWNRSYFDIQAVSLLSLSKRSRLPVSCILADVDQLGGINLKFGRSVGDDVLRNVGRILHSTCRAEDITCRFEPGVFAVLLAGIDRRCAGLLADRLRREVERQLKSRSNEEINATCSFGLADNLEPNISSLSEAANAALLRAKMRGGNCISIAGEADSLLCAAA